VVSDALEMRGIVNDFQTGEASVRALEAGVDVLLMPPDPTAALNGVMAAVKSGRLTQARIDASARRVLEAKARVGLHLNKLVNVSAVSGAVNTRESIAVAQEMTDRSVTLVRNQGKVVPLTNPQTTAFFILGEGARSREGEVMSEELRLRVPGARIELLYSSMSDFDLAAAFQRNQDATHYVIAAFTSVSAYRGNVALAGAYPQLVQNLIDTKKPVVLVAMGNPYLLRSFPKADAYLATYSTVAPSEISAVRALFGAIAVSGKLPVTIPGEAKYLDGISLPGPAATAGKAPAVKAVGAAN
jgi:beta-N-acetylhexosaminidase